VLLAQVEWSDGWRDVCVCVYIDIYIHIHSLSLSFSLSLSHIHTQCDVEASRTTQLSDFKLESCRLQDGERFLIDGCC
jgi:hypothetical protein